MVHEPSAAELDAGNPLQALFDQGHRVGTLARIYVPGGVLIDLPHRAYADRVAATRQALDQGAPVVYEAAFAADGVFVSVDILERRDRSFCLTEVKSTTGVKEHHVADVAVQARVARRSGLDVSRLEVMHLNRACAYPDLGDLFVRADVTAKAEARLDRIGGEVDALAAMLAAPLPRVAVGPHCAKPYACPFTARCWPVLPPHHVSTLYAMRQRALELDEQGYRTIFDLPDDFSLGPAADRQRRAVQTGRTIVEPRLAGALDGFAPPLAFLDFETVSLAVPVWNGCHPYDQVPAQWSCHVLDATGRLAHHEWLASGAGDPRPALAERLVEACAIARAVVAYHAPFERACLRQLAEAVPRLAPALDGIAARLVDLLPVVRNNVYHPDFGGSFSLKRVLPALVPEASYERLEIAEGETASLELARLLFRGAELPPSDHEALRRGLLAYCRMDTWGMVKLLERLRSLAVSA